MADPVAQKVGELAQLVRIWRDKDLIRNLVGQIIARKINGWATPPEDHLGTLAAIFGFVRNNIQFRGDPKGTDVFEGPDVTIKRGFGDCDAHSVMIASLAESINYPARLRVYSPDNTHWLHVAPVIGYPPGRPKHWITLDTTVRGQPMGYDNPQFPYRRTFAIR